MREARVVRWRARGTAVVVGESAMYRVDIGYGEVGEPENHPLGEWVGSATSEEHAAGQAMEVLWDDRLDVVCGPRIHVRKLEGDEASQEVLALA